MTPWRGSWHEAHDRAPRGPVSVRGAPTAGPNPSRSAVWPEAGRARPGAAHPRYIRTGAGTFSGGWSRPICAAFPHSAWPRIEWSMYGIRAREMRRCLGVRNDGQPCQAWALWRVPGQRCIRHTDVRPGRVGSERTHAIPCRCPAYRWPHRPGSGFCRWPEPPLVRDSTPPGSHRYSGGFRRARGRW
jgi:hypothetical protein